MILINKYKNIYKIKMCIIDFLIICKYFVYFSLFLLCLSINLLNYYILGNSNKILLKLLYNTINLNGYGMIKITQWYISRNQCFFDNKYIDCLFSDFYENCYVHSVNYTKKIFYQEYLNDFDNVFTIDESYNIKSGSIAQVYLCYYKDNPDKDPVILKVVHPETEYQLYWLEKYMCLYNFTTKKIKFFNKFKISFDIYSFVDNIKRQTNMHNEFNNLKYYYDSYKDNDIYIIPTPIFATNNILIMSYEEGISFYDIDASDYKKSKIILLLTLFMKNNNFNLDYIYLDIHSGNWRVQKYKNHYKIIIYDFGYCVKNILRLDIKEFLYNLDYNNTEKMCDIIYNYVINIDISRQIFVKNIIEYINKTLNINTNNTIINLNKNQDYLLKAIEYCNLNQYIVHNCLLEIIITRQIISNLMNEYIYDNHDNNNYNYNKCKDIILYHNSICKKNNMFPELIEYHTNYYLSDNINYNINNTLHDTLDDTDTLNNNISMLI